jgi:4-hydroxy-2-oxoheptanedioate aldolase
MSKTLKARLDDGELVIGILHDFTDPALIETSGYAGFDFVVLEYEHGVRSLETIQHLIRAAEGAGIDCLVRIGTIDPSLISRLLEAGATGIQVAHVKTREDAQTIVAAAMYPPHGARGQGYPRRGQLWKLGPNSAAADEESNRNVVLVAQIEDVEGVEQIEAILDVPGLTAVAPGPADLAASLGNVALDAPEVAAAVETVRAAVRERPDKYALGLLVEPSAAPALARSGTQMLMMNHDVIVLGEYLESLVKGTKDALASAALVSGGASGTR